MKTYSVILLAGAFALGSCGTTYQAQTPDAVYYSPEESQQPAQATTPPREQVQTVQGTDSDEGNYVVYQDGDNNNYNNQDYNNGYENGYDDGYYSRRINMFDRPGGLFSYNYYMMNGSMYSNSFLWNRFSYNSFGFYNSPYLSFGMPGISLGMNWGFPGGGWYNSFYNPYYGYSPYGHYGGYGGYYGGYGYGGYGKYINTNPRPASSYGPRQSLGSRAANTSGSNVASPREGVSSPRRTFTNRSSEQVQQNDNSHARRSFNENGERATQSNSHARQRESTQPQRRVFRKRSDEKPTQVSPRQEQRTTPQQQPQRRVFRSENTQRSSRPTQQTRTIQQPSRSVSTPSRSTSRPSSPRTFSPRGR